MRVWMIVAVAGCGRIGFDSVGTDAGPGASARSTIATGNEHACGIVDGALYCWGDNDEGQLGLGFTSVAEPAPTRVGLESDWTRIAAGFDHTCGARANGTAWCWGANARGQLGLGDDAPRSVPTLVTSGANVDQLFSRDAHTCMVREGSLSCWGKNSEGQLAIGNTDDRLVPTVVTDGCTRVSTHQGTTLVIRNGNLLGAGRNATAQLGLGDTANIQYRDLTPIDDGPWTAVGAGQNQSCGIRDTALFCWGENDMGQLGTGDQMNRTVPTAIESSQPWVDIDVNVFHACAVSLAGALFCWGRNDEGQLGDDGPDRMAPTRVSPFDDWVALSAGRFFSCAVRADGSIWCTGDNTQGAIGTGTTDPVTVWTPIAL